MILVVSIYGKSVAITTIKFNNETNCLQAISKSLDMEKQRGGLEVKARCVKN